MNRQEAIKWYETKLHVNETLGMLGPQNEAAGLALAALRTQEEAEKNEPLTLEEIKREKYVWLEPMKDWAKVVAYGLLYYGTEGYTKWSDLDGLGRLFFAYRHKPKEE